MLSAEATTQTSLEKIMQTHLPFAFVRKDGEEHVTYLSGDVEELATLDQIPRSVSDGTGELRYDTLSMIPFSQARERGMDVVPDASPIRCMNIREQTRLSLQDVLTYLPRERIEFDRIPEMDHSDEQYADDVRRVIEEQIKKGNACTIVISTNISGVIANMSPSKALTIFGNLLRQEFGAYMTFCFFDGKEYHIGASPERHITVDRGVVTMNPISGTYRKTNFLIKRDTFEEFLLDEKEINELFMCVDEEVKQMAQMCEEGGSIVGPLLKEMSGLVHTEYLLIGRSEQDCIDLLRTSMHAPTVTGSPAESAFSIIRNTERTPREYYASELVLLGHHPDGTEFLDSTITIRTMHVLPNGLIAMRVGASIVRDSVPEEEAKETRAKASGVMRAVQGTTAAHAAQLASIMNDELIEILQSRNAALNPFLFEDQQGKIQPVEELRGKTVTIIDFEDQFSYVLKHMIAAMGATANVKRFDAYDEESDTSDIVIVGPGPGNPCDESCPKMQKLGNVTSALLTKKRAFLSVCLGHQKLCETLGINVRCKDEPSQGMQREIELFGTREKLGFYNTFAGVHEDDIEGVEICSDENTREVFAVRGDHFSGFQFHPESIMSQNGFSVLANELRRILIP
ncbi:phenazine biosynthesis protein PhzE [Candidatus Peribacteria bacterium]|nr:phenazine biosynthesis protein PhzE [Candidatus Peribacteria bacterium]